MERTEHFTKLMERKSVLIDQLYLFAEKQLELIEEMDMTSLIALLSRKQHVILEIEDLDKKLKPFQAESPENRVWKSAETKEKCQTNIEQCKEKIKQIMELERLAEKNLVEKRNSVQKQLKHVDQGANIHRAYNKTASPYAATSSRGLDLSSG